MASEMLSLLPLSLDRGNKGEFRQHGRRKPAWISDMDSGEYDLPRRGPWGLSGTFENSLDKHLSNREILCRVPVLLSLLLMHSFRSKHSSSLFKYFR